MSRKLHIEKGNLVTRELLFAYLNNEMSEADKLRFEKQMEADEFLRDAVEGLRGADLQSVNAALDKLYNDIDIITGVKKPVSISPRVRMYAVAAMLIVFLGATFFIMDRLNQQTDTTQIALEEKTGETVLTDTTPAKSDMGGGSLDADTSVAVTTLRSKVAQEDEPMIAFENKTEMTAVKTIVLADEISPEEIAVSDDANFSLPQYEELAITEDATLQTGLSAPFTTTNVATTNETFGYTYQFEDKDIAAATEATKAGDITLSEVVVVDKRSKNIQLEKAEKLDDGKFKKSKSKNETTSGSAVYKEGEYDHSSDSVSGRLVEEVIPQFPGGEDSLKTYFARNIKNPDPYAGVSGDVYVKFLVNENGAVSNAEVIKGLGPAYDIEALRVVANMPAWIPGSRNGKAEKAYYTIIITF